MKQTRRVATILTQLIFISLTSFSQTRKFPSPLFADTIKNTLQGNVESIGVGKEIYVRYCVPCHGEKGKGDGLAAANLSKPPADHTSAFVQKQTDGAIFWIIIEGNDPMPKYKHALNESQTWAVVNYIRTLAKPTKK